LTHLIQKYSCLKMNRARAGGYKFLLIFNFFQIEDVPGASVISDLRALYFLYVKREDVTDICDQVIKGGIINYFGGQTFWSHLIGKNIHRTDIFIRGMDKYISLVYIFIHKI
jgi:hypothetical protein